MSTFRIIQADCVEAMREMDENSVDAIVTDPPYGLEFMGKEWDRFRPDGGGARRPSPAGTATDHMNRSDSHGPWGRRDRPISPNAHFRRNEKCAKCHRWRISSNRCECPNPEWVGRGDGPLAMWALQAWSMEWATEALRVLKPGGHLLAFGGTRTYHRLVCAIEDAGFEIRDTLAWLYGSGFPKSKNVGDGWGTALKPAHEPIVLARKPLSEKNVAANVERWGPGGLNIDGTRIGTGSDKAPGGNNGQAKVAGGLHGGGVDESAPTDYSTGRWPANVVIDEEAGRMLDEQSGDLHPGVTSGRLNRTGIFDPGEQPQHSAYRDTGGASRFFYCPKADRAEREIGLGHVTPGPVGGHLAQAEGTRMGRSTDEGANSRTTPAARNNHPTVKPIALMSWLCRMVTPPGGTVLDPFCGSGSTGIAALREGFEFIGIEKEPEYVKIARARIQGDAPLLNEEVT